MIIEAIIIEYLNEALDVPVYVNEPTNKQMPYVIIQQQSGGDENGIGSASVVFDSYAEAGDDLTALEVNNKVTEVMRRFTDVKNISKSKLNTTYRATDTTSKRACYTCLFDVVFLTD